MASWIGTGGSNPGHVKTAGNIGIGTTEPNELVHIDGGASSPVMWFTNNYTQQSVNDGLRLSMGGTGDFKVRQLESEPIDIYMGAGATPWYVKLRIAAGGDVGIGTTQPSKRLDVNGPVNTSDGYYRGTTKIVSSQQGTISEFATGTGPDDDGTARATINEIIAALVHHGLIEEEA
jgi:hypothetical protein